MGKAQLYLEKTAAQKVTYNPSNKASFSLMLSESLGFTQLMECDNEEGNSTLQFQRSTKHIYRNYQIVINVTGFCNLQLTCMAFL